LTADDIKDIIDIVAMMSLLAMASTRSACWVI